MTDATIVLGSARKGNDDCRLHGDATAFGELRNRLTGIAHRIVGRWSDAEDVVQDAWLRWQCCDRTRVANPTAFLVTTTTRLAINASRSARVRRETCAGPAMPEPVATADDPARATELMDIVDEGLLILLECLLPAGCGRPM